ncbi:MAG: hypothetical protein K2P85_04360 [Flavobacteriaceae bacterium]|nr:hypothetical protein [Flavobacteriaceae bacterium]
MLFSPDWRGNLFLLLPSSASGDKRKRLQWKAGKWKPKKARTIRSK